MTLIWQRLSAYPPGVNVPEAVRRGLEEAVAVALTVPPEPGLLPDQARHRADCAHLMLFLGDETGDRLRRRVWRYVDGAWCFASDITAAGRHDGMTPDAADAFMGVPRGFFRRRVEQSEVNLIPPAGDSGEATQGRLVSFLDMARLVRPSEKVSDGQNWSTWAATS